MPIRATLITKRLVRTIKFKNYAHWFAFRMALVANRALIDKWRCFSFEQLVCPNKQVDGDTQLRMLDNFLPSFTDWCGGILALPMKISVVDPVVQVALVLRLALFVQCHKQYMHFFIG